MSTVVNYHTYTAPAAPMDYSYSRHTNSAGAPLPRIPRRASSSRPITVAVAPTPKASTSASSPPATIQRVRSVEAAPQFVATPVPTVLVVRASPPLDPPADDASSSSSGSESYVQMNPRAKRVRTPKMQPFHSAAESTPTPTVANTKHKADSPVAAFPAEGAAVEDDAGNDTPRASTSDNTPRPHLHIETLAKVPIPRERLPLPMPMLRGETHRTVSAPHIDAAKTARKKTGEPLKSSLKSRRPIVRGDLSVVTGLPSTKSEPNTPSKSVHFDSKLEHVKLFLAEQKPLAISREGSPTDTSGTESDFPSAIFGPKSDGDDKVLTMSLKNMPTAPPADADIALEDLELSTDGTCLNGNIRVRNIAFEKWVAVRFTVDWWQTTSEVTAKYASSIPGGVFDRFAFTIRLGDMLARIEEKTMFFAIRYNVVGREIWDNNAGQNYQATFARVPRPLPHPRSAPSSPSPSPSLSSPSDASLASLKSKLENVVKGQETVGGFMAHGARRASAPFTLEASTSLSARYDFAASLKSPWRHSQPAASTTPPKSWHTRNVTYPNAFPQAHKRVSPTAAYGAGSGRQTMFDSPRAALVRGSPRILDVDDRSSPLERPSYSLYAIGSPEYDDTPMPMMSRRKARNHQRGYFDLGIAQDSPTVRRTPTGSPVLAPEAGSGASIVGTESERVPQGLWFVERGASEDTTPSATSSSNSESSQQSSPSGSPTRDEVFGFGGIRSPESESYSVFLNTYCYYTGTDDGFLETAQDGIQRSHSASSVEEFLSMSPSPSYMLSPGDTPTRSSSYDDVVSISSGGTTPTIRNMAAGDVVDSPKLLSPAR